MSHLGGRVSALVDGRLSVDATERALVHLASCASCRSDVAAERGVRQMLSAGEPTAPQDLTSALLALGGEHGPLPPRSAAMPEPRPGPRGSGGGATSRQGHGKGRETEWPPAAPATADGASPGEAATPAPWLRDLAGDRASRSGSARHAVSLPAARRARVAAGGSVAVLATGVLGVGLLGAPMADRVAAVGAATSPAAGSTAALASPTGPSGPVSASADGGLWEHVVRGTRVMCVLVIGS